MGYLADYQISSLPSGSQRISRAGWLYGSLWNRYFVIWTSMQSAELMTNPKTKLATATREPRNVTKNIASRSELGRGISRKSEAMKSNVAAAEPEMAPAMIPEPPRVRPTKKPGSTPATHRARIPKGERMTAKQTAQIATTTIKCLIVNWKRGNRIPDTTIPRFALNTYNGNAGRETAFDCVWLIYR
jgi:hypothetical protein